VSGIPAVQCASDEARVTMNYADTVVGTSKLIFWILLADGSQPDDDIDMALVGSGTYLQLPAGGTVDTPIQVFIRRSPSSTDWQFSLVSVIFSVLYVERVVFNVYDFQGEVAISRAVRKHITTYYILVQIYRLCVCVC